MAAIDHSAHDHHPDATELGSAPTRGPAVPTCQEELQGLIAAICANIICITSDAFITIDEDQRIVLFNHGAEKTFGYEAADVLGKPLDILIPEEVRDVHRELVREFGRSGVPTRRMTGHKVRGVRATGEVFPADATISQIEANGRKLYTAALRDITPQVRTTSLRQHLSETGHALAEAVGLDQVLTTIMNATVPRWADFACVFLLDDDEGITCPISRHRDPQHQPLVERLCPHLANGPDSVLARVLRTGEPEVAATTDDTWLRAISPAEEGYHLLLRLAPTSMIILPLIARARPIGAVICAITTTARHYDPEILTFAERLAARAALAIDNAKLNRGLQDAVRTRDEVLRIVAHDLRNPLNTISLAAGVLTETMPPEMARQFGPQLDLIRRSTERANHLIGDLLVATRIREGKLALDLKPIDTTSILQEVTALQQALVEERHLELVQRIPDELPAILADYDRVLQVFANLIGNALKFTPPGGRITMEAWPEDTYIHFTIADTGQGIPRQQLPRLFEAFWQGLPGPAGTAAGGAGLGLAISKGIVTAHGGRIWIESEVGEGTTVHFTIPIAE